MIVGLFLLDKSQKLDALQQNLLAIALVQSLVLKYLSP